MRLPKRPAEIAALPVKAALVGTFALSLAGFLGTWHRLLELTSHFKVQYLAAACACALCFGLARLPRWALAAAACALLNAASVLPLYLPAGRAMSGAVARRRVTILLANVNSANCEYQRVIDLARATSPDLIVLQEVTDDWARAFEPLRVQFTDAHVVPRPDNSGIAVYSRLPLSEARTVPLGGAGVPAVVTRVELGGAPFSLVTTHTFPPLAGLYEGRNEQLEQLARIARERTGPVVLVGDLNASPWSPYFKKLAREAGLSDSRRGFGVLPTWPTYRFLTSTPIDHCLISPDVSVVRVERGAQIGSDHFPLIVTLEIPETAR